MFADRQNHSIPNPTMDRNASNSEFFRDMQVSFRQDGRNKTIIANNDILKITELMKIAQHAIHRVGVL